MNPIQILLLRKKANAKLAKINAIRNNNNNYQHSPEYTAAQAEHRAACIEVARASGAPGY